MQTNDKRVRHLIEASKTYRDKRDSSALIIDDTLCEHVGSLFEYVAQHYHHAEDRYSLSHNLVTSHFVSAQVRFPVDLLVYRRYEEQTQWATFVKKHFPDQEIPKTKKARRQFHKEVDPTLLTDTAFKELHDQFQTKIDLAVTLLQKAVEHKLPFSVVLFDGWFLAPQFIQAIERLEKDWVSILKKNRNIEVNSFVLKAKEGKGVPLPGPHIKIEDLLPLIPAHAYRPIQVEGRTYWCFSRNVAIPALGKVRLVFSFDNAELKGDGAVLVTNRLDWSPQFIIQTHLRRWPIETFYQDSKGYLGLDEYRIRTNDHCLNSSIRQFTSEIQ